MTSTSAPILRASLACGAIVAVLLTGARPAADQPRATLRRAPETRMPATADSNSPAHWSGDTDKLAGRVARFYMHGKSVHEIVFER